MHVRNFIFIPRKPIITLDFLFVIVLRNDIGVIFEFFKILLRKCSPLERLDENSTNAF